MQQTLSIEERPEYIAACKILATLFRDKPSSKSLDSFFILLEKTALSKIWPAGSPDLLDAVQSKLLSHPRDKKLDLLWQNMIMGPEHLAAPPWGSVYLDHEQVIFGDSCVALSAFLRSIGLRLNTGVNEPEDHIGLMLWYVSVLLETGQNEHLVLLLREHLLPWSFRYTELFYASAQHPFFEGMITLLDFMLRDLQSCYKVHSNIKKIDF